MHYLGRGSYRKARNARWEDEVQKNTKSKATRVTGTTHPQYRFKADQVSHDPAAVSCNSKLLQASQVQPTYMRAMVDMVRGVVG